MKKFYRSTKDIKIAGVCAGIAEAYNLDPTLVRLAVVFVAVITGIVPAVVTYLVAWMIMPEAPSENNQ